MRTQQSSYLPLDPHRGRTVSGDDLGDIVAAHRADAHRANAGNADAQRDTTAGADPRQFIVAIIPAHNEQDRIGACLASLHRQSRPVDLIIVVADNCTDDTVTHAVAAGATVVETVGNVDRKAGALNFTLNRILGRLGDDDGALLMDADTELSDGFLAVASRHLWSPTDDSPVGGVGGIFMGSRHLTDDDGGRWSLVRQLQHNEYVRYSRHVARRQGRALVLTGTGSLFRAGALSEVAQARRVGLLPDEGNSRSVYDTASLTEDNELTLSLKQLGYRTQSPRECLVYTAMMPTIAKLFEQRRRWQRGALENLGSHGLGRHTLPYFLRQMGTYVGVLFLPLYVVTLSTALIRFGGVDWLRPLWVTVAVVYLIEQAWSVRRGGWRSVGLSLVVIPELWHTIVLNCVYAVSLLGLLAGTGERWGRGVDERSSDQLAQTDTSASDEQQEHHVRTPLAATHGQPTWRRLILIPAVLITAVAVIVGLPLMALGAAWAAIAVFVLTGFLLTLIRLVPLPMA